MRKIELLVISAIRNKQSVHIGGGDDIHFSWRIFNHFMHYRLRGSTIATFDNRRLTLTDCGRHSVTFKSRLNAIAYAFNLPITFCLKDKTMVLLVDGIQTEERHFRMEWNGVSISVDVIL